MRVPDANGRARGFSLVELLVVLSILALLLTISMPFLITALRASELQAAADELQVRFSATRDLAISHNTFTRMIFSEGPRTYRALEYDPEDSTWAQIGSEYSLPPHVGFAQGGVNFAGGQVTFDPHGSLMGGGDISLQHLYSGNQLKLVAIIAVGKLQEEEG